MEGIPNAIDGLNIDYFDELKSKINARLLQLRTEHAHRQIVEFPWLYGALGQVPSRVMLICENPSLRGVEKASVRPIVGDVPTIEDQWCGGRRSNCIKRLRPALFDVGLKVTHSDAPGGWRCYLTNVIKEADVVSSFAGRDKSTIATEWAEVLAWEFERVQPRLLFTVGDSATGLVRLLQSRRLVPSTLVPRRLMHYSNRGPGITDDVVRGSITAALRSGLDATASIA